MGTIDVPLEFYLDDAEAAQVVGLVRELGAAGAEPADATFYDRSWRHALRLPERLRLFLAGFRRGEAAAACLVHGLPTDDAVLGPTPRHWDTPAGDRATLGHELFLGLCGLVLGEPFGWATLQSGRIVQNILPIVGDERRQNGYGSRALLEFHTEDGFHPQRCDYLLLLGLRNPDAVPTIVSSVRDVKLDPEDRAVLSQPRFLIFPDDEHVRQLQARDPDHPALRRARQLLEAPDPVPVLFGDPADPYLRLDRPFMRCVGDDPVAERALDTLMAELERVQQDVVVRPGSLLVVDNYRAVHGRRSFDVRYDGTDRWLKKLTASRDLRRGLSSGRVLA